jgi:uncharacterized protein (TIGR02996 family)
MTEERAFLLAILERPADDAPKLIYADWLEERGDPRGEFLRGVVKSRHERVRELDGQSADVSRAIRQQVPARLRELAATFDPSWLAVVGDPEIEGCARSAGSDWSLRFEFVCDRTWADMKPTGDNNVRHCEACSENVYFCDNLADARQHAEAGCCIAVDLGVIRRDGDLRPPRMFLGRPSRESVLETYKENLDPVSQARLDARKQAGANLQ